MELVILKAGWPAHLLPVVHYTHFIGGVMVFGT
jgi:hypothetical protein